MVGLVGALLHGTPAIVPYRARGALREALAKNGAIVRKHLGYADIPQRFAAPVNGFCRDYLNPYFNFHRPCLFAETITDAKGKQRKR